MQENSVKWFDSLLEGVFDFGLLSCEGDDWDIAMSAERSIVIIDNIGGILIAGLIMNGVDD